MGRSATVRRAAPGRFGPIVHHLRPGLMDLHTTEVAHAVRPGVLGRLVQCLVISWRKSPTMAVKWHLWFDVFTL